MKTGTEEDHYTQWINSRTKKTFATSGSVSELDKYFRLELQDTQEPIQWWRDHGNSFPALSSFALDVLAIPAMASDCERQFSLAKLTLTSQRPAMGADTLERIHSQRIGAQAVIGAFRTVATAVAEAEASIPTIEERHRQAATRLCVDLRTLPQTHPLAALRNKASRRYLSPMQGIASVVAKASTERMEVIGAFALRPWAKRIPVSAEMDLAGTVQPPNPQGIIITTASSQKDGRVGFLSLLTDSSAVGKQNFLSCYQIAREQALTVSNIKGGWKATGLWPVSVAKPLLSPLLLENSNKRKNDAKNTHTAFRSPFSTSEWQTDASQIAWSTPKRPQDLKVQVLQFNQLDDDVPTKRLLFRKITKGFDEKDGLLAKAQLQIQALETQLPAVKPKKRKRVETSPNSRFADIEAVQRAQAEVNAAEKGDTDGTEDEISEIGDDCIVCWTRKGTCFRAAEALGAENGVSIAKMSWLSNKQSGKAYGSMVIYVTKGSDARRLLDGHYFDLAGESAITNVFEPRKGPGGYQSMWHSNWTKMIPTQQHDGPWPIRSMLWVRSDIEAEQLPIPSADLTAAVLRLPERDVLVVSVKQQRNTTTAYGDRGRRTGDDFLAEDTNIWKAAKYLEPGKDAMGDKVPPQKKAGGTMTRNRAEQAEQLLDTFFPPPPARIEEEGLRPQRRAVAMPALTLEEVEVKVMAAKPWKAAGTDGLPAMVWRQLWPVVKHRALALFRASLREGVVHYQTERTTRNPLCVLTNKHWQCLFLFGRQSWGR
ncbi:tyrosinase [Purpureocillium lavendulum]|uniref:Tyrosinase n=1 Tax=Purpureocillium lavendulum TaxID=1247861 RepID=A0AB34FDL3_9HYPO|nr:tyrosinase [Purpureocillium lavendulum]